MATGKQIKIYLEDGSPTGIRLIEQTNWTGQAITCPRKSIPALKNWKEVNRPGVYFLFGTDEEDKNKAYIGESTNVWDRLQNHLIEKTFWENVVIITSKDENVNITQIKYLESKAISEAKVAKRYVLENVKEERLPLLSRGDEASTEDYYATMKMLVGVSGFLILEEIIPTKPIKTELPNEETKTEENGLALKLEINNVVANALLTNEGIVVLKSSEAILETKDYMNPGYKAKRAKLVEDKTIVLNSGKYIFENNVLFRSPSEAASIIAGYNMNGREYWRNGTNQSLNEIDEEAKSKLKPTEEIA